MGMVNPALIQSFASPEVAEENPNNVHRGIRPERRPEVTSGPRLGQVTRLRQRDDLVEKPGRKRVRSAILSPRWLAISGALAGVAVLVAIFGGFALWSKSRTGQVAVAESAYSEENVRVVSKFASPGREQALELVRRAVVTRDPRVIAEVFRDGAARSAEIIGFLNGLEATDGPIERYEWLSSMDVNGLLVEGVAVISKGFERPAERIAFLTPDAVGIWQMDFDAFARTVTPSWQLLLAGAAEQARVRMIAGRDVYFNGPFQDESQWRCYRLESPDTEETLHGYCRAGTPEEAAMEKLFAEGETMSRATLELRRVADAGARQFEISRVVAKDWILPAEEQ